MLRHASPELPACRACLPSVGPLEATHTIAALPAADANLPDQDWIEVECRECVPTKDNSQTELRRTVEPGRNVLDFDL